MKLKNISVFVILLLFSCVEGDPSWNTPAIEPPDAFKSNTTVWRYKDDTSVLYINIDEEIPVPFDLILINCIDCDDEVSKPKFDGFSSGSSLLLGGIINKIDTRYVFQITKRQDFEVETQRLYKFYLFLGNCDNDGEKIEVIINIIDIDDTAPTIQVHQRPCIIPENTPGPANCTFELVDPDSSLKDIIFEFPNENDVNLHFKMVLNESTIDIDNHKAETYLEVIKDLDFERVPVYYFEIRAIDPQSNNSTDQIIVKVKDMPDMDPIWNNIITTETLKEHETKEYPIYATDGDLEIKAEIDYKFEITKANPCHENITVTKDPESQKGLIKVDNIDRDEPELVDNTIKCIIVAYEVQNKSAATPQEILFIIEDINDNIPKITIIKNEIELIEYEYISISDVFLVTDIDQGPNAQFDVSLNDVGNTKFSKAFQIVPFNGYKNWSFSLSVVDAEILDYDEENWRNFDLQIYSKDRGDNPKYQEDCAKINIKLLNKNNKAPYFIGEEKDFIVEIFENVNKSAEIIKIVAKDDDTYDIVRFKLITGEQSFEIKVPEEQIKSEWSATIVTKSDKVFDYEKQKEVVIQVAAMDQLTPGINHTTFQQITIQVQDVNDESPKLILPNDTPEIKEHEENGTRVSPSFEAIDVDTSAELKLTIKWDECYAVKEGQKIKDIEKFRDVFIVDVKYLEDDKGKERKGYANGTLVVSNNVTLDYEEYEILYLKIQAQDIKQEEGNGFDNAIIAVIIIDINDHAPEFTDTSINTPKYVTEHSVRGTLIGTIQAKDRDGPEFNHVYYYLVPVNGTKEGLVEIDINSGVLTVNETDAIDADCPNTYTLNYTVIASDAELGLNGNLNETEIFITINDINDNPPTLLSELTSPYTLKEGNHLNVYLQTIDGFDYDRDDPHNKIWYRLNSQFDETIREYFYVDEMSGMIYANNTFPWSEERENITVDLIMRDNYKSPTEIPLVEYPKFIVFIEDINDNRPILEQNIEMKASEDDKEGKFIAKIIATDKDKPCTPHTFIDYRIKKILKPDKEELTEEILMLENKHEDADKKCQYYANLYTNQPLKNYYGMYSVCILAVNIGAEDLNDEHCYNLEITAFNFKPPKIIFPKNNGIIVLNKNQQIGKPLITADNTWLANFEATDDQGGKFTMVFDKVNANWNKMFILDNLSDSKAQLLLTELPKDDDKEIHLTIEAGHNGTGSSDRVVQSSFTIYFIDPRELPHFNTTEEQFQITENEENVCKTFQHAIDNKCLQNPNCKFDIFYYQLNETEFEFFDVNQTNPELCITKPLDREEYPYHFLKIVATNTPDAPPQALPQNITILKIDIEVCDVNDNAPEFELEVYKAGITTETEQYATIVTINATDKDTIDDGKLRYEIVNNSFTSVGSNIDISIPFKIKNTQEIANTFKPLAKMSGYFLFTVKVFDSDDLHWDEAQVKIYIISDTNQFEFIFKNEYKDVEIHSRMIELIFSNATEYSCIIQKFTEESEDSTVVTAYFIDEEKNESANKKIIEDVIFKNSDSLKKEFRALGLIFDTINEAKPEASSNEELLQTLLIVVSVVLGTIIIVLIVAFVLRTRSLNQRITSMTTNVFGSTKSDLNRIGTNAPGTNRHAVEANPVWNEEKNDINHFDTISQASGGSDLIGIEDNPEFQYTRKISKTDNDNQVFEQKNNGISFDDDDDDDLTRLPGFSSNQFKFS